MDGPWQRIARIRCPHDHLVGAEVWTNGPTVVERRAGSPAPDAFGESAQSWCMDAGHGWEITPRDRARIAAARDDYAAHRARWSTAAGLARFTPWAGDDINVHAKRTLDRTALMP
ncbi:hypothetical protein [Nakamurella sp.]|uniref:hypothetical protein n=1 Tax=Nakamurella sp. TaxID=1869182 RepID=UPI0037844C65